MKKAEFLIFILIATILSLVPIFRWPQGYSFSDGIAQFMPVVVLAMRNLLNGELPLFNFYQFAGVPILEIGYYPVLYPLSLISYLFAKFVLLDESQSWNILILFQMILNGAASYVFLSRFTNKWQIKYIAGLCSTLAGMALFQGGEWFYSLVCFGFIPLILTCILDLSRQCSRKNILKLSVSIISFYLGSNIQYFFYAMHAVLPLGFVLIFNTGGEEKPSAKLKCFLIAGLICAIAILPFTISTSIYSQTSVRQAGQVPIDKYYWVTADADSVLKCSWWPCKAVDGNDSLRPKYSNFIGPAPVLGVLLIPFLFFVRNNRFKFFLLVGLLIILATTLLSFGQNGWISPLLYNIPPYGWFRHSLKWLTIAQATAIPIGLISILLVFRSRLVLNLTTLVTVLLFAFVIFSWEFIPRLTEVALPLAQPPIYEKYYRNHSLWDRGLDYSSQTHKYLNAHNYASYWKVPVLLGYEPQMPKRNDVLVNGNFFRGFDVDVSKVRLKEWHNWGIKYIYVPIDKAELTEKILKERFPKIILNRKDFKEVAVFYSDKARKLVFGRGVALNSLEISTTKIRANVDSQKPTKLHFNWLMNDYFTSYVNGKRVELKSDKRGRPLIDLPRGHNLSIELVYSHPILNWKVGIIGMIVSLLLLRAKKP